MCAALLAGQARSGMDIEEEHEGYGEELGEGEEYEGEEEAEGEMDTEDEEYNLTHFGISQALPVPEGPPDFSAGGISSASVAVAVRKSRS